MHDRVSARLGAALIGLGLSACNRCGGEERSDLDASLLAPRAAVVESEPIPAPERLPLPPLPELEAVDRSITSPRGGVALPRGCRFEGAERSGAAPAGLVPLVRAPAPGALALVRRDEGGVSAGGLATSLGETEPKIRALPRSDRDPILAMSEASTLVAWTRPAASGDSPSATAMRELALLDLDATTAVRLAEGDGLVVADLRCAPWGCGILTSREGRVRGSGAEVFARPAGSASWLRVTLETAGQESGDPIALSVGRTGPGEDTDAGADGAAISALVTEGAETLSFRVPLHGAPEVAARLPTPYGVVAALAGPAPAVLAHASPPSSEGCMPGEGLDWIHAGGAARWPAPIAPESASVDPLERGSLVTYLTQLRCDQPRRVLYAALIDDGGAPLTPPIPVSDAAAYAIASRGNAVELWIWQGTGGAEPALLRWFKIHCDLAAAPPVPN
jgi:hypothetical protein